MKKVSSNLIAIFLFLTTLVLTVLPITLPVQAFLVSSPPISSSRVESAIKLDRLLAQNTPKAAEATSLLLEGQALFDQHKYREAISKFELALPLYQAERDRFYEGICLFFIGLARLPLRETEAALKAWETSLPIWQEMNNTAMLAGTLFLVGKSYEFKSGISYKNAAQIFESFTKDSILAEEAKLSCPGIKRFSDSDPTLLPRLETGLETTRATQNRFQEASCLLLIGLAQLNLSNLEAAINSYEASIKIWQQINNKIMAGISFNTIGSIYELKAMVSYKNSVDAIESLMVNDIRIEQWKFMLAEFQNLSYEPLINLLWKRQRYQAVFNYVERAKARAFLDQVAYGKIDFRAGNYDTQLLAKEEALRDEITKMRQSRGNLPDDQAIKDKLKELETLLADLQVHAPEVASLKRVNVATVEEIQRLLDTDTTLVEYFVTEERTLAFIITRNTFKTVALNVTQQQLEQTINAFLEFSSLDNPSPPVLQKLHQWLIAPLQSYLTTPTIGIVPHGVLHYLPFAALTNDGKRYLSDDHALFYLPSASVLRFLKDKHKPSTGTMLALANPEAPGLPILNLVDDEVKAIAPLYKSTILIGKEATESAVWSQAGKAEILHIAAHGTYNPETPIFSTVFLQEDTQNKSLCNGNSHCDGRLEAHEIYGLDLTKATKLVVLSACQLQRGKLKAGDEVVAVNRAFLFAGTPSTLASLWTVKERPTMLLMERFYAHLKANKSKAEALRQAQIEVRQTYPNPYYWAAFVLTGDYKN